jgi:hypothetical protein
LRVDVPLFPRLAKTVDSDPTPAAARGLGTTREASVSRFLTVERDWAEQRTEEADGRDRKSQATVLVELMTGATLFQTPGREGLAHLTSGSMRRQTTCTDCRDGPGEILRGHLFVVQTGQGSVVA